MTVVSIKLAKPFIQKKVQAKGIKENILVGIRVYDDSELKDIRKEYLSKFSTVRLNRLNKQLEALKEDISLSDEAFDARVTELESKISQANEDILSYSQEFTRSNIAYIKNATLSMTDNSGKATDLIIVDTRTAQPIESLWKTPDECLAVLLDMYLQSPFYKDSLSKEVSEAIFNTDFKDIELGN